jgi:transposase
MVPIAQETSPDVLRQYALWLEEEVKRLTRENSQLKNAQDRDRQLALSTELQDQLTRLRQKFFGMGRERAAEPEARPVGHPKQELLPHGGRPVQESGEKNPKLPWRGFLHTCDEELLIDEAKARGIEPALASVWEEVPGLTQDSTEVTIIERIYIELGHKRQKYRLKKEYNTTGKEVLITAPGPVKLKPGSQYSVDFAVAVVSDKYEFHLPLERQRRKMEGAGLDIDVKTLFTLCRDVAEHCDKEVIAQIRDDILSDFCAAHLDESPWPILGGTNGYMWAMSNRKGGYFCFEPSRSGKVAVEMLKGYKGSVITDGYSGYKRVKDLSDVRLAHCWAHARREFFERSADYPKESAEILPLIDELFSLERRSGKFEELSKIRRDESRLVVGKIHKWLLDTRPRFLPQDGIVKAIDYCLKYWSGLTLFLKDLSVPLSNNDAERALRHVVLGRKNFAGSKSIDGADVAAVLYTVIESAKRVGLNPSEYLKYVITERWYGEKPLSPYRLAKASFGENEKNPTPKKTDWRI